MDVVVMVRLLTEETSVSFELFKRDFSMMSEDQLGIRVTNLGDVISQCFGVAILI